MITSTCHSKNIFDIYNDKDVWRILIPNISFSNAFSIRDEKQPSARMKFYNGKWFLKDFGNPFQDKAENYIDYIMRSKSLSFIEAVDYVKNNLKPLESLKSTEKQYKGTKGVILNTKNREFTEYDKNYWNSLYVSLDQLKTKHITSVDFVYMKVLDTNKVLAYQVDPDELAYSYPHGINDLNIFMRTVYFPENRKFKFLKNINRTVIQNIHWLNDRNSDTVWIMNAMKDILVLENLTQDNIIGLNNEGSFFDKKFLTYLKSRFKYIIYFADNDYNKDPNPGIEYAKKYEKLYNIKYVYLESKFKTTDISEFIFKYGKEKAKELVTTLRDAIRRRVSIL